MSDHARLASGLGAAALGTVMIVGLAGPVAAQNLYPPTPPGPTVTTTPAEVGGVRVTRTVPAAPARAADVDVLGRRLAVTGADALPYAAAAVVLVVGGVGILLVTRRRRPDHAE